MRKLRLSRTRIRYRIRLFTHGGVCVGLISLVGAGAGSLLSPAMGASLLARPPGSGILQYIQSRTPTATAINIGTVILAEPASETPFPIQVALSDGVPKNSFIRIRGLPPSTALSEGHSIAPGAWAVPFVGLPTLRLSVPVGLSGKSEIVIALVTVDGAVLAEAKTTLVIASASTIAPGQPAQERKSVASIGPSVPALPGGGQQNATPRQTAPAAPARTEEQQRALRFVARGNELLSDGDVAAARLYYQRAVDAGLHEGALALAASYDPIELGRLGVKGLQPDANLARKWYERAKELGAPEAEERLKRLSTR